MSHLHQLLLILSLIALTHIHALPWTSIGPTTIDSRTTTGTITHIISNGMTGATIITPGSGLWTTPNIGVNDPTWSHVDVINMCQSIPAFHVYTSNPKWAVAACGTTQRTLTSRVITPAIWLSVNGVWKLLSININITSSITDVHIATITPPTLFIATRQGMLRVVTDSMGNVMTSQQVLIDGVLKVTVEDNTNPTSTIMYASTPRAQLYISQDLGLTWNMTSSITSLYTSSCPYTELEHAIITSTSNMTYIAMASHQCIVIISTTTQGASFTRELSVNISTSTDVTSLAMVMINTNITYICGTGTYFGRLTRGVGFTNVATTKQASYNCKQMMYDTTSIYVASDAGVSRFTLSSQTFTDTTLTVTMPSVTEVLSSAFVAQSGMYITAAQSFPTLRGSSAGTFISHPTNTLQPTSVSYDSARGVVYTTTTSLRTIERTLPPTVAIEIPYRDIARHNMSNDCWIIVNHYVLDVTSIINIHPGGVTNLVTQCGKDATQIWNAVHMSSTLSRLPRYIIGTLSYTSIDVATHSSPSDCYIIYMDRVLNVTMYVTMYPNLINLCGTDATDSLTQTPTLTPSQIKSSFIGRLTIVADATIRTYSYAHVARHHVIHDCWVVCNQKVVDVTSLIQSGNSQISVDKCGSDFVTTNITLMNDMSSLVLGAITTPIPFATLNVANNVPTYVAPNTQVADQGMICSTFHNNGLTSSACYILDFATNTSTPLPTDLTAPYEQYLLGGTRAGVADTTAIIAVSSTGAVYVRANGVSATRPIAPWNGMIPVGIAQNPSNYWDVIVTLSSGFIYRSTDFGLTWNNITGNLPSTSISSVIVLDMDTYIATLVATHMGVYMTTDDIKIKGSWIRIGESFPLVTTSSLQYVNDYDMIIVGTLGRGLYTLSQVTNAIDNARAILLTVPITTAIPTTLAPTTTTPPTTPGGGNNIPTDPITPTSPPTTRPDVTSPPTRSTGVGAASGSTGAATSSSTTILGFDLKIAIPIMVGAVVVIIVAILLLWKWCSSRDTPLRNMRKASMDFSDAAISGAPSAPTYAMSIKFSHDVDVAKLPTQRQNAPSIYDEPAITDSPLHSAAMSPMKSSVDHGDWNARQQRMTVASGGWYEGSSQPSPTGYRQDPNYVDPQQQQQQQEYRWSQDDGQQVQQQQEYQWSQDTSQQQTWDNQSSQQQEYQWTQPESPSTQQWTQTRTWRNPSAALGWNT